MRALTFCIALLFPALASAQSDYSLAWKIIGTIGDNKYNELALDINEGTRFLSLNGVLISSENNAGAPATGTCFFGSEENIYCSLSASTTVFSLTIRPTLSGTITLVNSFEGTPAETKTLEFIP
jgi:hypothetical protein